ncbi:hypothetical protein WJX75_000016 [Coccomyxa subellipsoidea]|uniref:NADP-dependent oxidoreductase domain-containing protein n=1 Tax=Coccomyxa subellipsoidea TaxID=248742 RepID=A0ABR2YUN2_9CHLO
MTDLWDEYTTEACRMRFIHSIYNFPDMPTVQLSSGHHMPILGVSTWLKQNVQETVELALRSGFRHIDVSSQRGNEAQIGAALLKVFSDWIVQRPDVWVTGKVWHEGTACPTPTDVRRQVNETLAALKLDHFDLCLLPAHNNMTAFKAALDDNEALVDEGKLRLHRPPGRFLIEQLAEVHGQRSASSRSSTLWKCTPATVTMRCWHFCRCQGVHVMASSWPATAYMLQHKDVPALLRKPLVTNIARSMGKRPAQVLIRWALQHGTSVSPKAGSPEHVQGILDVLNCELLEDDYYVHLRAYRTRLPPPTLPVCSAQPHFL